MTSLGLLLLLLLSMKYYDANAVIKYIFKTNLIKDQLIKIVRIVKDIRRS